MRHRYNAQTKFFPRVAAEATRRAITLDVKAKNNDNRKEIEKDKPNN